MTGTIWFLATLFFLLTLAYHHASLIVYSIASLLILIAYSLLGYPSAMNLFFWWGLYCFFVILLNSKPCRRWLISRHILTYFKKAMPALSRTEKEALNAGTVAWDREIYSGNPDWALLHQHRKATLSTEEQRFLDGPVEQLCNMINDWEITNKYKDLSATMWQFLKEEGFFGLIIAKEYGGKAFSAYAHSQVLVKIASRSVTVASTVSVPNSLGPAELLQAYGTTEQKNYYLPRLAQGKDIPCFALTSPEAGSDAASMPDYGTVCKGEFEGEEIIGIRLNWNKRYITLAPIATVIGLAFKLYDPDHLIGKTKDIGITCALIPASTPGITVGNRHMPLHTPFQNGPIQGKDVFIPIKWVIGGDAMLGQGWRMLMESLATGRAISLPSMAIGGAKASTLLCGAYSRIRKQFNMAIGRFEGIQEVLTRIAGNTYTMDAARHLILSAIDHGEMPAVPSAIAKYHITERARSVINDAMDIHGGKGICVGPRNYLANIYQSMPISITVEGANILTRSMIIFGQGAIRCHPFILNEIKAVNNDDPITGLHDFDDALFAHMGFLYSNKIRAFWLGLTEAYFTFPNTPKPVKRYYQLLTRYSSAFAFVADMSLLTLGGALKRKENLSARLGDVLSYLYLCSAVLKHFYDQGKSRTDLPIVHWACQDLLYKVEQQLHEILANLPNRFIAFGLRIAIFPLGRRRSKPRDRLTHQVAHLLITPNPARKRLTDGCHQGKEENNPIATLEKALIKIIATEHLERKLLRARKQRKITGVTFTEQVQSATEKQIITQSEAEQLMDCYRTRMDIIAVDDFESVLFESL